MLDTADDLVAAVNAAANVSGTLHPVSFGVGERLFRSGDECRNFVVILSGTVRIQLACRTGRDVTLFRLHAGQSCALTSACLFRKINYFAEGVAESDVEAAIIPAGNFIRLATTSPQLCAHLLEDFSTRVADMVSLVDRLSARNLDAELAQFLLRHCDEQLRVTFAHQAIADEIGTAREVVSRKLKALEKAGRLRLGRGRLQILQPGALRAIASADPA